jgi:ABC-type branched-subunit amino acid transport system ATPase component
MILQLINITFGYSLAKQILKNISLSLEEKRIYVLMGINGAGKTTLFNLVSGFLKPQSGKIVFSGMNINQQRPHKRNRLGIGRTFQDLRLITKLTVKENIVLAMQHNPTDNWLNAMLNERYHKKTNQWLDNKANEILEQYLISDVRNSLAAEISYGQQKLLTLACCYANGATLLLLDEAVAGIQPEYRHKIAILINHLKEQGKTILLIEHNTEFIEDVADKIFFLHEGKISDFDSIEKFRYDKQVMKAYI